MVMVWGGTAVFACDFFGVTTTGKIRGNYGLEVQFAGDTSDCYVLDNSPSGETTYSVTFMINNQLTVLTDAHSILRAQGIGAASTAFQVVLRKAHTGVDYLFIYAFRDNNTRSRVLLAITPATKQQYYKIDWQASSAPGANDGFLRIFKADAQENWNCLKEVIGIDNDARVVDQLYLGSYAGIDPSTTGWISFDNFASFRSIDDYSPTCQSTFYD
jgi:hypothetical protein